MQKMGITSLEGNTFSHQQGEKPASDRATNTYFAYKHTNKAKKISYKQNKTYKMTKQRAAPNHNYMH